MKRVLLVVVLFILFAGAGYAARTYWWDPAHPRPPAGWCCTKQAQECQWSQGTTDCSAKGGLLFDTTKSSCDSACHTLQT